MKEIAEELDILELASVGTRDMLQLKWCRELAVQLQKHRVIASLMTDDAIPVKCTYFEKSNEQNWLVPTHQDLSIPVSTRVEHPDLTGWSMKENQLFVRSPIEVLQNSLALRLHIDDCGETDGPLRVVPGSHLHGRVNAAEVPQRKKCMGEVICSITAGAAILMRPLILHASSKSYGTSRRRVLHFLFAPSTLPFGLEWPNAKEVILEE